MMGLSGNTKGRSDKEAHEYMKTQLQPLVDKMNELRQDAQEKSSTTEITDMTVDDVRLWIKSFEAQKTELLMAQGSIRFFGDFGHMGKLRLLGAYVEIRRMIDGFLMILKTRLEYLLINSTIEPASSGVRHKCERCEIATCCDAGVVTLKIIDPVERDMMLTLLDKNCETDFKEKTSA